MVDFGLYILKINLFAALCICLVSLFSKLLKNRYSSWWRYYVWLAIAIILIIPFESFKQAEIVNIEIPYGEASAFESETMETPAADSIVRNTKKESTDATPVKSTQNTTNASSWKQFFSKFILLDYITILKYIWISGIFILGCVQLINYQMTFRLLKRWAVKCTTQNHLAQYHDVCEKKDLKTPPCLMICSKITSPILAGLIKPRLYLPDTTYSEEELKLIYHHELSHYQKKDLWYKLFLLLIHTLYWFNPMLYVMRKEADRDIEYLCDSNVMKICSVNERTIYHHLLLKTAINRRHVHYISASLNDDMTNFKERIMHMMKINSLKKGKVIVFALVGLLLTANLAVGCSSKKNTKTKEKVETGKEIETKQKPKTQEETTETPENTEEVKSSAETNSEAEPNSSKVDKSGDYIGNIANPNPPDDDVYGTYSQTDPNKCLLVHVTNIDNANIKFRFTIATYKEGVESNYHKDYYSEKLLFKEHIAHYNGDGYYEYIGKDYHLFLKYDSGLERDMSDYIVEVYGLDKLVNQSQYGPWPGAPSYNGVKGIVFGRGLPFAG